MFGTCISYEFQMKYNFVSDNFIVFKAVRIVEPSLNEVEPLTWWSKITPLE